MKKYDYLIVGAGLFGAVFACEMKKTGKKINLEVKIDKAIIGGGIIKIGDQVTDGSIRKELNSLRKK